MSNFLSLASRGWRKLPLPRGVRAAAGPAIGAAVRLFRRSPPPQRRPLETIEPGPLVLSGFLGDALGLGMAARSTRANLQALDIEATPHDLAFIRRAPLYERFVLPAEGPGGVWICQCNPPEFERLRLGLAPADIADRYRIGIWAWELERLPPLWVEAARSFHEIWAPTTFVADAVAASLPPGDRPKIKVAPLAVGAPAARERDRARFDLPEDAFVALTMFDLRSTRARKNPDGALDAYVRAFPEPSADRLLVCKVLASDAAPAEFADLKRRLEGRPDVRLMTETLSDEAVGALIASADVLISLHRSEGYGLTLAEAMHRGVCVLATGWSGNMDFMSEAEAVITPYRLVPVQDPQKQYAGLSARWAEPDIDFAAQALARLEADPAHRADLAERGRRRIQAHEAAALANLGQATWLKKVAHQSKVLEAGPEHAIGD